MPPLVGATPGVVTLKINGLDCSAMDDQTVLEVAREQSIRIPTLCHLEGLENVGGCRLCLVEIKGMRGLVAACVTRVSEGMEVQTSTPQIEAYRRLIVQMLFTERNHVCSVCVSNGHCELQDLAVELGVTHVEIPYLYPRCDLDASHPRFVLDHNRCTLCQRCVRVCDEIEGAHVWDNKGRGIECRVVTGLSEPWSTSETCTSCGKCVHVCPTGALFEKGRSAGEMAKRAPQLPYLQITRKGAARG